MIGFLGIEVLPTARNARNEEKATMVIRNKPKSKSLVKTVMGYGCAFERNRYPRSSESLQDFIDTRKAKIEQSKRIKAFSIEYLITVNGDPGREFEAKISI